MLGNTSLLLRDVGLAVYTGGVYAAVAAKEGEAPGPRLGDPAANWTLGARLRGRDWGKLSHEPWRDRPT